MTNEARELQKNAVNQLLIKKNNSDQKTILFRAPTGSGKTYMMADFMNRVIHDEPDAVFLVSTRSTAQLGKQNHESFIKYYQDGYFPNLKSYLIDTEAMNDNRVEATFFIDPNYNVYNLPSDLLKDGGRIVTPFKAFLKTLQSPIALNGLGKTLYLIKDEEHIATNNLDKSIECFKKTFCFSATPKLEKGREIDVAISDDEAVNAKLIKSIELRSDSETLKDALNKFLEVKEDYISKIGVNPCFMIQIDNMEKGSSELLSIFETLKSFPELKWLSILSDKKSSKDYDTNDEIKNTLPVDKWKRYARNPNSSIDVIIFKLSVKEGWDIPRACMLYQIRNTKSKQLDEQVIGRIRRNPRLMDLETLPEDVQQLALTAYIWGICPKELKTTKKVNLRNKEQIQNLLKVKTTRLKPLNKKYDFDFSKFMDSIELDLAPKSIFSLNSEINKDSYVADVLYKNINDYTSWWKVATNFEDLKRKCQNFYSDYDSSMEIAEDVSFPISTYYIDNGNYKEINSWIWKNIDESDEEFSFDSDAESRWVKVLKKYCKEGHIKKADIDLFGNNVVFLWGKNYLPNSQVKFQYFNNGIHDSYPDFIMEDSNGKIHLFEIKSLNNNRNLTIDQMEYNNKIQALKDCYKACSRITNQVFYIPILACNVWRIIRYKNGEEDNLSEEQFLNSF